MAQLANFLVFVLLVPLLFSFWVEGAGFLASIPDLAPLKWFGLGFLLYSVVGLVMIGPVVQFFETAIHELIHAFVGLLFLNPTKAILARSDTGGETVFERGPNPLIALAPYFFPLLTLPLLAIKPITSGLSATAGHVLDFLIGTSLAFHYVMHIKQFRFSQPDLQQAGLIVAVGVTYTFMLIFLVSTIEVVLGNYKSIVDFLVGSVAHAPEYYAAIIAWIQSLAAGS